MSPRINHQHQLLGMAQENLTRLELQHNQEKRWEKIVRRWKNLSVNTRCVVVGDINLKWSTPDMGHKKMVDEIKDYIETSGFQQLVKEYTRSWRSQADSLLDYVWSNCAEKVVKVVNDSWGASNHNVVGIELKLKGELSAGNSIVKRMWKEFDMKGCMKMFSDSNWQEIPEH